MYKQHVYLFAWAQNVDDIINFVTIGQMLPIYRDFLDFQDGGRLPSWICDDIIIA